MLSSPRVLRCAIAVATLLLTAMTMSACALETDGGEDSALTADELDAKKPLSVYFNEPKLGGEDRNLERRLITLIDRAERGSEIRGAYYHFSSRRVADALIEAKKKRNVDVRLVLNDPSPDEDPEDLADRILARLKDGLGKGAVTVCKRGSGACIGNHINHNKFMIFSELHSGIKHVVVQSSANLGSGHLHNNMLVFRDNTRLYKSYLGYWRDLNGRKKNLDYSGSMTAKDVRVFISPSAKPDPVVDVLNNVHCDKGNGRIRVAMALFTTERIAIAQRLVDLSAQGCDVKVLAREGGKGAAKRVLETLRTGGVSVDEFPSASGNNIHSKYLLIDAPYGSDGAERKLIFTGSHNYTGEALRNNDEVLMRVEDDAIFARYMTNWRLIRDQIRGS